MSDSPLATWCNEAAALLGTPGSVHTTKFPQLLAKEGDIRGKSIASTTWDAAKNGIATAATPEEKDKLVLELGRTAKRNDQLFGKLGLTEQQLQEFEPVGEKVGQVTKDFRKAGIALASKDGKLPGLSNVETMPEEDVKALKDEGVRLQRKFMAAINKDKDPEKALAALEEFEQFAQGLQAFDSQYSKIRGKYTVLEKGKLTPLEFANVARIEQLVAAAQTDWVSAIEGADNNLKTGERGRNRSYFENKIKLVRASYEKWKQEWPKLSVYDVQDEDHEFGLGGLDKIVEDAWDLASSDEYLAPDEGLNEMKADVVLKWQNFLASTTNAEKLARRGPVASQKVQDLNGGRTWKKAYKIGDAVYTLSSSRSADVSFKRAIPKKMRVSSRPDVKSFIYHLRPYAS